LTVQAALLRDKQFARAEYLAEFREDIADFISADVVDSCTAKDRRELPPSFAHHYCSFTDPAGGSGSDSFAVAVAHLEGERAVLDAVREVHPPFSPEKTVQEFCAFLKTYRVSEVTGDAYAGEWPREQFSKHGVAYHPSTLTKSAIYLECLSLLNSNAAQLLDLERLRNQLLGLERRTSRLGRDSVDHAPGPGSHDDLVNAACGALRLAHCEAGGVLGLVEFLRDGGPDWMLDPTPQPKAAVITTFKSDDPFASQGRFPPIVPPKAEVYDLSPPCPHCGGELVVVDEGARMAKCSACGATQIQLSFASRFAPSPGGMSRKHLPQRGRGGGGFPHGLFGRFGQ
jgi:hypothetical protein